VGGGLAEQRLFDDQFVEVHGLVSESSRKLNGIKGRIVGFNPQKDRYDVKLDGHRYNETLGVVQKLDAGAKTYNIKFANLRIIGDDLSKALRIGGTGRLHGLQSQSSRMLNEKEGRVLKYDSEKKRYTIEILDDRGNAGQFSVKPSNVRRLGTLALLNSMEKRIIDFKARADGVRDRLGRAPPSGRERVAALGRIAMRVDRLVMSTRQLQTDMEEVDFDSPELEGEVDKSHPVFSGSLRTVARLRIDYMKEELEGEILPACEEAERAFREVNEAAGVGEAAEAEAVDKGEAATPVAC
jgi:hypothetical protein